MTDHHEGSELQVLSRIGGVLTINDRHWAELKPSLRSPIHPWLSGCNRRRVRVIALVAVAVMSVVGVAVVAAPVAGAKGLTLRQWARTDGPRFVQMVNAATKTLKNPSRSTCNRLLNDANHVALPPNKAAASALTTAIRSVQRSTKTCVSSGTSAKTALYVVAASEALSTLLNAHGIAVAGLSNGGAPAGATTTTTSGPAVGSVGTPAQITQGGVNAATVTVTAVNVTTQPGDPYGDAPQNGYYAIVNVSVQVLPGFAQGFDVNPLDFYVLVNGQQYTGDNGNSFEALNDNQSEMDATTLGAGQSTTGLIPFDIPVGHGQVVYAPNENGQPVAEWNF